MPTTATLSPGLQLSTRSDSRTISTATKAQTGPGQLPLLMWLQQALRWALDKSDTRRVRVSAQKQASMHRCQRQLLLYSPECGSWPGGAVSGSSCRPMTWLSLYVHLPYSVTSRWPLSSRVGYEDPFGGTEMVTGEGRVSSQQTMVSWTACASWLPQQAG